MGAASNDAESMADIGSIVTYKLTAEDAVEARAILRDVSLFTARSNQVFRGVMEMERILTGQPIAVLGLQPTALQPGDVVATLQALQHSLRNAAEDGVESSLRELSAGAVDTEWEDAEVPLIEDSEPDGSEDRAPAPDSEDDEEEQGDEEDLGV